MNKEKVNHPDHYNSGKFEAMDVIADAGYGEGFCLGNVIKYAMRYGKKGGRNQIDLLKLIHYGIIALPVNDVEGENET